ncbi:MAG: lysylphosphatidylglycerol synthase domain-containing protein [Thermodesulfobacteriota bacterium]|jgi:putative membrane protein
MTTTPAKRLGVHFAAILGGLGILGLLLWNVGVTDVVYYLRQIGWSAPLLLLPYLGVALCDAKGWSCAIPPAARPAPLPLWRLTLVRLAGEAINNLTPTANLGGEPVKAYLLRLQGVSADAGLASVVAAKTALTISQVVFILIGVPFLLSRLGWLRQDWWVLGPLALLAYGFASLLVRWQRRGLVGKGFRLLRRLLPRWRALARWEGRADRIDVHLLHFYGSDPRRFFSCVAYHFLGWILGAGEVWVFFTLMGVQITVVDALIVETMVQPFTAAALIIPGALGVQEAGGVFLCRLLGFDEGAGFTLMALKRAREAIYNLIGLAVIARFSGAFLPRQPHAS